MLTACGEKWKIYSEPGSYGPYVVITTGRRKVVMFKDDIKRMLRAIETELRNGA